MTFYLPAVSSVKPVDHLSNRVTINHHHLQHTQHKWPIETGCVSNYQAHFKKKKGLAGDQQWQTHEFLYSGLVSVRDSASLERTGDDGIVSLQCLPRIPNMFSFHRCVLLKHSDRLNKSVAAQEVFNGRQTMHAGWKWWIWRGIYLRSSPWPWFVLIKTMTPTYKEGLCVVDLTVKKKCWMSSLARCFPGKRQAELRSADLPTTCQYSHGLIKLNSTLNTQILEVPCNLEITVKGFCLGDRAPPTVR